MDLLTWFQDCVARGDLEQYQLMIVRKWLMTAVFFNDANPPKSSQEKGMDCGQDTKVRGNKDSTVPPPFLGGGSPQIL